MATSGERNATNTIVCAFILKKNKFPPFLCIRKRMDYQMMRGGNADINLVVSEGGSGEIYSWISLITLFPFLYQPMVNPYYKSWIRKLLNFSQKLLITSIISRKLYTKYEQLRLGPLDSTKYDEICRVCMGQTNVVQIFTQLN